MSVCDNCGRFEGTVRWTESYVPAHGVTERLFCEGCALRSQISHAEDRAAQLPSLRARLETWSAANEKGTDRL